MIGKLLRYGRRWLAPLESEWEWRWGAQTADSRRMLRNLKDSYRGKTKRCFIIGNGPSLNNMDFRPLKSEVTFGQNRIYLLFDKMGFQTTYLVCINYLVLQQFGNEMDRLPMPKFIEWGQRRYLPNSRNVIYLRWIDGPSVEHPPGPRRLPFSKNIARRVYLGSTVTYVSMQIAFYLGFEHVVLIGVDHNFATKGEEGKVVTSQGADPNHFAPNYFGSGVQWQLPGLDSSEIAYRVAKQAYENAEREIVDATVDGKLQVFKKVRFQDVF